MQGKRESCSGFSILELVIALSLVLIALLAACQLIVESLTIIESTGRSLRDPTVGTAAAWLRRDIHASFAVDVLLPTWSSDAMVLRNPWQETITVERVDDTLIRVVHDMDDQEIERRVLMHGVRYWRWILIAPGLIDCELRTSAHIDPTVAAVVRDPARLAKSGTRIERFRFSLRGRYGGRSW